MGKLGRPSRQVLPDLLVLKQRERTFAESRLRNRCVVRVTVHSCLFFSAGISAMLMLATAVAKLLPQTRTSSTSSTTTFTGLCLLRIATAALPRPPSESADPGCQLLSGGTGSRPGTARSLRNVAGNARLIYRSSEIRRVYVRGRRVAGSAPAEPFMGIFVYVKSGGGFKSQPPQAIQNGWRC